MERGHRTRHARRYLILVFLLQRIGDAAMIWYTFQPENPFMALRGTAVGSLVWTAVLAIGVWRRHRWARYVLTSFNWLYVFAFSLALLQSWNELTRAILSPYLAALAALALYGGANAILVRSSRVRHFANV